MCAAAGCVQVQEDAAVATCLHYSYGELVALSRNPVYHSGNEALPEREIQRTLCIGTFGFFAQKRRKKTATRKNVE